MTETYLPQSAIDKKAKTHEIEKMLYKKYMAGIIGDLPFSKIAPFHLERIKKDMTDKKKSDREGKAHAEKPKAGRAGSNWTG